ncbi:wdsam1 protein [Anaeramoeba flamelloides]|uniref:Wdsam1 protein n=1 Tax=Anaeramoeba flamelloides TaxID=1746091 RepID=A0ABQ8YZ11_9EUKA|nr:wdsam1 protein [Anaeramoeba flamelloides]
MNNKNNSETQSQEYVCLNEKEEDQNINKQLDKLKNKEPFIVCPISKEIMRNPVVAEDGQTYEQTIFNKPRVSPVNKQQIGDNLVPNMFAQHMINSYLTQKEKECNSLIKEFIEQKRYAYALRTFKIKEEFSKEESHKEMKITIMKSLFQKGTKGTYRFELAEHFLSKNKKEKAIQIYESMLLKRYPKNEDKNIQMFFPIEMTDNTQTQSLQQLNSEETLLNLKILLKLLPLYKFYFQTNLKNNYKNKAKQTQILIIQIYLKYNKLVEALIYLNEFKETEDLNILTLWVQFFEKKNNKTKLAEYLNKIGLINFQKLNFKIALHCFKNSLKLEPNNENYQANLINLYIALDKKEKSIELLLKLGRKYENDDPNKSKKYYLQASELDHKNKEIVTALNRVYQSEGNLKEGIRFRYNNILQTSIENNNPFLVFQEIGNIFSDLTKKIDEQDEIIKKQKEIIQNQQYLLSDYKRLKMHFGMNYDLPKILYGHTGTIIKIFPMNQNKIISFGKDYQIIIWNKYYKIEKTIKVDQKVNIATFLKLNENQFLFIESHIIKIYNIQGECEKIISEHNSPIQSLVKLKNNKFITYDNNFLILWDNNFIVENMITIKDIKNNNINNNCTFGNRPGSLFGNQKKNSLFGSRNVQNQNRIDCLAECKDGKILIFTNTGTFLFNSLNDNSYTKCLDKYSHIEIIGNIINFFDSNYNNILTKYQINFITDKIKFLINTNNKFKNFGKSGKLFQFNYNLYLYISNKSNTNDKGLIFNNNNSRKYNKSTLSNPRNSTFVVILNNNFKTIDQIEAFDTKIIYINKLNPNELVTGSENGEIKIWDFRNLIRKIKKHMIKEETIRKLMKNNFFGTKEYEEIFSQKIEKILLPNNIENILLNKCPFNENKKVYQTHFLFLLREGYNYNKLIKIINDNNYKSKYKYNQKLSELPFEYDQEFKISKWILLHKEGIPFNSDILNEIFSNRDRFILENYNLSTSLEIQTAKMLFYLKFGNQDIFSNFDSNYLCKSISNYTIKFLNNEIILNQTPKTITGQKGGTGMFAKSHVQSSSLFASKRNSMFNNQLINDNLYSYLRQNQQYNLLFKTQIQPNNYLTLTWKFI